MTKENGKRGRGRPRRDGSSGTDQRAQILGVAVDLFARQGYAATSMSAIARAVGLDQSSLYYWFKGKDEILRHLVESNRSSLELAESISSTPGNIPEKLYAVLHADVLMLCRMPFDFYLMEDAAREQPDKFVEFDEDFRMLAEAVRAIIAAGVEDGSLIGCDPQVAAMVALACDEGVQHRFHRPHGLLSKETADAAVNEPDTCPVKADSTETSPKVQDTPEPPTSSDGESCKGEPDVPNLDMFVLADSTASATVARLLANDTIEEVRARARELGWVEASA